VCVCVCVCVCVWDFYGLSSPILAVGQPWSFERLQVHNTFTEETENKKY